MQTKHTPGPWCAWQSSGGARGVGKAYTDEDDLFYVANPENRPDIENEANMQLAATAPELLEVTRRLVQWDLDYPVNCHNGYAGLEALNKIIADAKAAIAKATLPLNPA
ncbi:MAG: hypothetical protein ACRER8_11970 [Pseudomonas sp.]|uniref:hypothetical protein n=1 Tax=Pseudomonas sp. TaxID=306 RepID=UPI003D6DBD92